MSFQKYKLEQKVLLDQLTDKKLFDYVMRNMQSSMLSIGFSDDLINYFVTKFARLDFQDFYKKYSEEIKKVYSIGFFQKIVPEYFNKQVIPHIPESDTTLDLGCGTGILVKTLAKSQKFKNLFGIDLNKYEEWEEFSSPGIKFEVVKEQHFKEYLEKIHPDNIILTWTLHHMDYKEQSRYLIEIHELIDPGSRLIILEDSYSNLLPPSIGLNIYDSFMRLNTDERKIVMSVYDWIANRILAKRSRIPMPFAYRTLEGWKSIFEEIGYKTVLTTFIGFPDKSDTNTPQSLLIIEK